ncbi:MAG: hypothetical protein P1U32_00530 [Legionellaceae bacterium]|nr:hypothetical protein [Legionellaceae bacterium]
MTDYLMESLAQIAVPLDLLNDGVSFSKTVEELRASLLDGILKRDITFLCSKKLEEVKGRVVKAHQRAEASQKRAERIAQLKAVSQLPGDKEILKIAVSASEAAKKAVERAQDASHRVAKEYERALSLIDAAKDASEALKGAKSALKVAQEGTDAFRQAQETADEAEQIFNAARQDVLIATKHIEAIERCAEAAARSAEAATRCAEISTNTDSLSFYDKRAAAKSLEATATAAEDAAVAAEKAFIPIKGLTKTKNACEARKKAKHYAECSQKSLARAQEYLEAYTDPVAQQAVEEVRLASVRAREAAFLGNEALAEAAFYVARATANTMKAHIAFVQSTPEEKAAKEADLREMRTAQNALIAKERLAQSESAQSLLAKKRDIEEKKCHEEVASKAEEKAIAAAQSTTALNNEVFEEKTEKELTKETIVSVLNLIVRYVAEILEKHHWNEHFLEALGVPNAEGEPFDLEASRATDSLQVRQVKKLINALYHLETGLKVVESQEVKPLIRQLVNRNDEIVAENVAKEQGKYGIGSWLYSGFSTLSFYATAGTNLATSKSGNKLLEFSNHLYQSLDLLTHIEPEFLGAFKPEWERIKAVLESDALQEKLAAAKTFVDKQDSSGFLKKAAYLKGVLFDQLRPKATGGADYSLMLQLLTGLGQVIDEKTGDLQDAFSDSEDALSSLKKLIVGSGMQVDMADKFESLVRAEIKSRPAAEKARLQELNQIQNKLKKAFGRLSGKRMLIAVDLVQYASIAWYASSLLTEIVKSTSSLNATSQKAIRDIIIALRDEYLAELVAFADKIEEASLSEPGSITTPLIAELDTYYEKIRAQKGIVDLTELGPLQSEAFTKKRLEKAKVRREAHEAALCDIQEVLMPAFQCLTSENPSTLELDKMADAYRILQPHIEAIDVEWSAQTLAAVYRAEQNVKLLTQAFREEPPYPLLKQNEKVMALKQRLENLVKTKKLAIQLTDDVVSDAILPVHPDLKAPFIKTVPQVLQSTQNLPENGEPIAHISAWKQHIYEKRLALFASKTFATGPDAWVKPPSDRKRQQYLVADNSENAPIKKLGMLLDDMREKLEKYAIDKASSEASPLNVKHIAATLMDLKYSSEKIQDLKGEKYWTVTGGEKRQNIEYSVYTIQFIESLVQAIVKAYPYGETVYSTTKEGGAHYASVFKAHTKHYTAPSNMDASAWAYSAMHAALTAPAHFEAVIQGQPELPTVGKKVADKEARAFSNEVGKLVGHANLKWWFVRYPVLAFDAVNILFQRLTGQTTVDQKAMNAANKAAGAAYKSMTNHGLEGLNAHVFHELLCSADKLEKDLGLMPGLLSLPLERAIDDYIKAFLEPLSIPSEKYFKIRVNEKSYYERSSRVSDSVSHGQFFHRRFELGNVYDLALVAREDLVLNADDACAAVELQNYLRSGQLKLSQMRPTVLRIKSCVNGKDVFRYFVYGKPDAGNWTFTALDAEQFKTGVDFESKGLQYPYSSDLCEYITKKGGHTEKKLVKQREEMAREEGVDRALDLELMRIQKSKAFTLKYANRLYMGALKDALRPAVQTLVSGEGAFESRTFDVLYKQPVEDLSVFDVSDEKGSCRLDAMREYISNLEDYLKPTYDEAHGFFFYLFEDKATHAKKLAWAKQLRALIDDKSKKPSERIKAVQALLAQKDFQKDMRVCSPWLSWAGLARCIVWLLSCVRLCSYKTAGIQSLDHVIRAGDAMVSELQVFDELYAKDYRRLDAMLKQVSALEGYLKSKHDNPYKHAKRAKSYVGRFTLFEDMFTHAHKHAWVVQLRQIGEDNSRSPRARIDAMRDLMAKPEFKQDMLTYCPMDDKLTYRAVKRIVLWLLSCVGLYSAPCTKEYRALTRAADKKTSFSATPLIDVGLFSESVPSTERSYTAESALEKLGLAPAA